jgi:hypothetical protein
MLPSAQHGDWLLAQPAAPAAPAREQLPASASGKQR